MGETERTLALRAVFGRAVNIVSFIGKLEQLNLSLILQGIETYAKTGLLVIKQEVLWVDLYFRDGRLMCIGPVRPNATLGDRLLQAGVISTQALQETISTLGIAQPGETRIALTLMDLGYVSHEGLRIWATKEASEVIQVLLKWQGGEIYFEEGQQPPTDRLLVALSPTSLLPSTATPTAPTVASAAVPASVPTFPGMPGQASSAAVEEKRRAGLIATPPAQMGASQLISVADKPSSGVSFALPESPMPIFNMFGNSDSPVPLPLLPPQRVTVPVAPMCIDTSFMRPEMVLLPLDLSALRNRNPQVQITPEQWRILTRVDGRTSLQLICQQLAMPSNLVCQLVGELIAAGLIQVSMPMQQVPMDELSPVSRELITAGLGNGYIAPGYAAIPSQPWAAISPSTEILPPSSSSSIPFETRSQWGNGGNGATFVPGQGWIAASQPLQPLQPSGPLYATHNVYVQAGGRS